MGYIYSMATLEKGMIHVLDEIEWDDERFHPTDQNGIKLKTYDLFISVIFHTIFSVCCWLWGNCNLESKTMDKGRGWSTVQCKVSLPLPVLHILSIEASSVASLLCIFPEIVCEHTWMSGNIYVHSYALLPFLLSSVSWRSFSASSYRDALKLIQTVGLHILDRFLEMI